MENILKLKDILDYFKSRSYTIINSDIELTRKIIGPRNISEASGNHISFLSSKYEATADKLIEKSHSALVVVDSKIYQSFDDSLKKQITAFIVLSEAPKKTFVDCLHHLFREEEVIREIHPSTVIHPSVKYGKNIYIGPNTVIDKNVTIGNDCFIGPNCHIQKGTIIGNRVIIRSNVTIGNQGFGFVKDEAGNNINFPHFGNVIIEDDVQIGSSTCIDRGALSDTFIKEGVKIDNHVNIGHNVQIGRNSLIIAFTWIGGSTIIGDNCWVSPSVLLKNGITVGDNSTLYMGCVVTKDVPSNVTVSGYPARIIEKKQ